MKICVAEISGVNRNDGIYIMLKEHKPSTLGSFLHLRYGIIKAFYY